MSVSNHLADNIAIRPEMETGDAIDTMALAINHVRNTVSMVEMALCDASENRVMTTSPDVLSATLHGVETHLAVMDQLSEYVWEASKAQQAGGDDHG